MKFPEATIEGIAASYMPAHAHLRGAVEQAIRCALELSLIQAWSFGDDDDCLVCQKRTNSLAAYPSDWGVRLGPNRIAHVGCVNELIEGARLTHSTELSKEDPK